MEAQLLQASPIWEVILAIRTCWQSFDLSDSYFDAPWASPRLSFESVAEYGDEHDAPFVMCEKDRSLIKRIIAMGHTSTLEHAKFTFHLSDVSRALLQQIARHRMTSPSVKSTRYTLKRMIKGEVAPRDLIYLTGNESVDKFNEDTLRGVVKMAEECPHISNDELKYALPEAYKTSMVWTVNARSLRNLFDLRMAPKAMQEFRDATLALIDCIPEEYHCLFEDIWEAHNA